MRTKILLAVFCIALTATMGFDCVNDGFLVSVNIKGVTGTFQVNRGDGSFDDFKVVHASDYLDPDFSDEIKDVRIYDIKVSTIGDFAGNVNSGTVSVNGVDVLTLVGSTPWNSFHTPQSLLTSTFIQRIPGGIATLVNAIKNKQDVTLRGFGSLSAAVNQDDLFVKVEVLGQVDAGVD